MNVLSSFETLISKLIEIHHLRDAAALLSWDQETYMPSGGGQARAEQIATLQTLAHDKFVSSEIEELLDPWIDRDTGQIRTDVPSELNLPSRAFLRETWRDFSRAKKLPSAFVNQLERECSLAQQVWSEARKNKDFPSFLPNLRKLLTLKLEETQYLGYSDSPYDALLDTYEPGATVAQLKPLFATIRDRLVPLLHQVLNSSVKPNESLLTQPYDTTRQLEFGRDGPRKNGIPIFPWALGSFCSSLHDLISSHRCSGDNSSI